MDRSLTAVIAIWLMSAMASAQTQTQPRPAIDDAGVMASQQSDQPRGFPYNTGGPSVEIAQAQVPLRDFLSSRQDLQRAELIERIESQGVWLQRLLDERDRQYAQRFASQQDAVQAALASAKEAVLKAEAAANIRFDSVNEFRATLTDQAENFMNKSTADARFDSLEEKLNSVYDRLNNMQAQGKGSADTWGWVVGVGGMLIALSALMFNFTGRRLRE